MFCPDGVVDIPEACGAFNPGSNPGRDALFRLRVIQSKIRSHFSYYKKNPNDLAKSSQLIRFFLK